VVAIVWPSAIGWNRRPWSCTAATVVGANAHYASAGLVVAFVRVGTLDNPDALAPDIHIFTASKQAWVILPSGTPAFEQYYERKRMWSKEALARREALLPQIEAYQRAREAAGLTGRRNS
jgi:hypothetical protein